MLLKYSYLKIKKKSYGSTKMQKKSDIIEKNPEDPHDCDYIFL